MGLGNMTPAAEFNFYVDPHAAAVVLGSGAKVTLFGLHATHQAVASEAQMGRLAGMDTAVGRAVHGMLARPRAGGLGTAAHPMHDPCVIAWVLWPELFSGRDCFVGVALEGELRGAFDDRLAWAVEAGGERVRGGPGGGGGVVRPDAGCFAGRIWVTHPVDAMLLEARLAIAAMKAAAVEARRVHARAELMRHMRGTAAKMVGMGVEEAVAKVSGEWMAAWGLGAEAYSGLAAGVEGFVRAFVVDARGSDSGTQAGLVAALGGLDGALKDAGLTLADEMAFRSECRHGWWGVVVPGEGGRAFWADGALERCGGGEA